MQKQKKIAVVGAGLVGTLLAIYLKRAGHQVDVYDRSKDIRTIEFSGRSINLVMSDRGWKALEKLGLDVTMSAPDDGYSSGDYLNLSNIGASNNNARNNNVENCGDVPPAAVQCGISQRK